MADDRAKATKPVKLTAQRTVKGELYETEKEFLIPRYLEGYEARGEGVVLTMLEECEVTRLKNALGTAILDAVNGKVRKPAKQIEVKVSA